LVHGAIFLEVKWPEYEAGELPYIVLRLKMCAAVPLLPHTCLCVMLNSAQKQLDIIVNITVTVTMIIMVTPSPIQCPTIPY
jgi:hypothetical protein